MRKMHKCLRMNGLEKRNACVSALVHDQFEAKYAKKPFLGGHGKVFSSDTFWDATDWPDFKLFLRLGKGVHFLKKKKLCTLQDLF